MNRRKSKPSASGGSTLIGRLFEAERAKVSIVSVVALALGLLLYAHEAFRTRTVRLQASTPLTYVDVREFRGEDARVTRASFDNARLTLSSDFENGVIVDDMTLSLHLVRSDFRPSANCSLSDADERRLKPIRWSYPLQWRSFDGMRQVEGGYLLTGRAAVLGMIVAPQSNPVIQQKLDYEDARRGVAPGVQHHFVREPFDQIVEYFEADPEYRDGTAWACLEVTLQPVGHERRTVRRLLGVVDRPFRPTHRRIVHLSEDRRDRTETRAFEIDGRYVAPGMELASARSFDFFGPLKYFFQ